MLVHKIRSDKAFLKISPPPLSAFGIFPFEEAIGEKIVSHHMYEIFQPKKKP